MSIIHDAIGDTSTRDDQFKAVYLQKMIAHAHLTTAIAQIWPIKPVLATGNIQ